MFDNRVDSMKVSDNSSNVRPFSFFHCSNADDQEACEWTVTGFHHLHEVIESMIQSKSWDK